MDAQTQAAARATCESVAAAHGLEIVEFFLGHEGRGQVLRVTLDRTTDEEESLTLDEITRVSEELSRALDLEDPIPGAYTLEVASAGLERPLVKPADYQRFGGREIKVKVLEAIEGRKNFKGAIRVASEQAFVLDLPEGGVVEIPFGSVQRAKLVVDWEAELRRADRANAARLKEES